MDTQQQDAIYRRVLKACAPVAWPQPWAFLAGASDHSGSTKYFDPVGPVADPEDLTSRLLEHFPQEALAAAGVVDQTPDGDPVLAEPLCGEILIPVNRALKGSRDILTSAGLLSGRSLPVLAAADDLHTYANTEQAEGRLYVAADLRDVAVLRALQLPATTVHGMSDLDWQQIAELCDHYGLPRAAMFRAATAVTSTAPASADPEVTQDALQSLAEDLRRIRGRSRSLSSRCRLTIVAWSPDSLSRDVPPGVEEVISYLGQVSAHLRIDVSRIDVWRPSGKDVSRLEFVLSLKKADLIRQVLLDSSRTSVPLSKYLPVSQSASDPTGAGSYRGAHSRLAVAAAEAGQDAEARERLRQARRAMAEFIGERVVGPMVDAALSAASPDDRASKLTMAELSRTFFLENTEISVAFSRPDHQRSADDEKLLHRRIQNLIKLANASVNLKKQSDGGKS